MNKYVENVRMLKFPSYMVEGMKIGHVEIEGLKEVPFEIKRFFYIFGSGNVGIIRGKHANRKSQFVLLNIAGASKVKIIDEEGNTAVYELKRPYDALFLPEYVWKEMYDFTADSVLMVLTSEYYNDAEYIRDFDDYVKIMKEEQMNERG